MGTLQPRKNIPMLIKAYLKIKDRIPGIKLVVAGNRDAYNFDKRIDEAVRKNTPLNPPSKRGEGIKRGDIIFPGFIDEEDKLALFQSAHLFVFPSLYEGFGIPILEAMSQNVPVAASDIPSLSEVGNGAYLKFNPRNLDEMAEKLYTVCVNEDLRNKLINLGQSRVRFFLGKGRRIRCWRYMAR
jgi:glycosyltransferase involved in cell wall biosynthesis